MPPVTQPPVPLPPVPAGSPVRRRAFDRETLDEIASELGQSLTCAPFRFRGQPVWRLAIPIVSGPVVRGETSEPLPESIAGLEAILTFWLSLGRVDVSAPAVSVVATGIVAVDFVPGVEAIFRYPGGSVTAARNGRIMVRTGPSPGGAAPSDAPELEGFQEGE